MLTRNLYKILTVLCTLALAAVTVFVLLRWQQIPDQIPTHFNFAGEPDAYGGKGMLLVLVGAAWAVFLSVSLSMKHPEKWNMPVKITAENQSRLFAIARAMMEAVKVETTALFVVLLISIAKAIPVSGTLMMILAGSILVTVIAGIAMMYKHK